MERIVLAYSGGRASSIAIPWLADRYRAEIVALTLDIGQDGDLEDVRDRALAAGAVRAHVLDVREEFARDYLLSALKAGALYQNSRSLATILARPLIAQKLVDIADIEQTTTVAHGAAGDMRIGAAAHALKPHIAVIVPSIAGGRGPERPSPLKSPADCPDEAAYVEITFDRGVPTAINGIPMPLLDLIGSLDILAGAHGVGCLDQLETPGGSVLHAGHGDLETTVITEEAGRFSRTVTRQYADIIDTGSWFGIHRRALDAYVDRIQEHVNGVIRLKLFKGNCTIVDRRPSSPRQAVVAVSPKSLTYLGTAKA